MNRSWKVKLELFRLARPWLLMLALGATSIPAQSPHPVRRVGPITTVSDTGLLRSVSYVRALPGGRVIASDNAGSRVLLLDSSLKRIASLTGEVPAGATPMFAGPRGALLGFRGDSSLLIDIAAHSVSVLDETGRPAREMALPMSDVQSLVGGPFGTPAVDPLERLVFRQTFPEYLRERTPERLLSRPVDTVAVLRIGVRTRQRDTVGFVRTYGTSMTVLFDQTGEEKSSTIVSNPYPIVDDWAVLPDGRVAFLRGRDFHLDFVAMDGSRSAGPRIAFPWQHLDDQAKSRLIDSVNAVLDSARKVREDQRLETLKSNPQAAGPLARVPTGFMRMVSADQLTDYRPAFAAGAIRVDPQGRLWVRTTMPSDTGPIYFVLDDQGRLVDRVQIPFGRVISGFGPGVVYMGVLDRGSARVEIARLR